MAFNYEIDRVEKAAPKAFERHVLTQTLSQGLYRSWRCARPDSGTYAFQVTTIPWYLFFSGDLGCWAFRRCEDMIPWFRGSLRDPGYIAEKVPHEMPTEEFSEAKAERALRDFFWDRDGASMERRKAALQALRDGACHDGEEAFWRETYDSVWQGDPPSVRDLKPSFCWCVLAMRHFFKLLDQEVPGGEIQA